MMSKTETAHTQEPWAAGVTVIDGKQYFAVAEAKNTKRVLALCGLVGADDEAESIGNARRIAGAINALKYLGQDRLDEGWNWLENGEAFIETAAELDRVKLLLTAKDTETEVPLSKKDDDYAHGVALMRAKISELTAERDALKAQLVAPAVAVKPVAYAIFAENGNARFWTTAPQNARRMADELGAKLVRLYAEPQPPAVADGAAPLTDEKIDELWRGIAGTLLPLAARKLGRAIEAAHGIALR